MRLYVPILFLTLVLRASFSLAAPTVEQKPNPIDLSPRLSEEPIYSSEPHERNWSVRAGFIGGALKETEQSAQRITYATRYEFMKQTLTAWHADVALGQDNFVRLSLGKKFYFPLEPVTKPYYKLAIGDLVDSTDGIGSIFNLKKFQAMAAVGLDDLFRWNERLQGEVGVSYALIGPQFEMSLGIAF